MRDQIVSGVKDQDPSQGLPKVQGLNHQKTIDTCSAAEKAAVQSQGMRVRTAHNNVMNMKKMPHTRNISFVISITILDETNALR